MHLTNPKLQRFKCRKRECHNFTFGRIEIRVEPSGLSLSPAHYVSKLRVLPIGALLSDFRSLRHLLARICHTRPDICCAVNVSAQVTKKKFGAQNVKEIKKTVSHVKETGTQGLNYVKLDKDTLLIAFYFKLSLLNKKGNGSLLGYLFS